MLGMRRRKTIFLSMPVSPIFYSQWPCYLPLVESARRTSRSVSRFLILRRLSNSFLPFATAICILIRPPLLYNATGTIVKPLFSRVRSISSISFLFTIPTSKPCGIGASELSGYSCMTSPPITTFSTSTPLQRPIYICSRLRLRFFKRLLARISNNNNNNNNDLIINTTEI